MRVHLSTIVLFGLLLAPPALARPLDADACARLKRQREALEKTDAPEAVKQPPPGRALRVLDEPALQIRTLIDIDGQLRFRCAMDLPIASLRPDLLVETPDVVEGEPADKPPGAGTAHANKPAAVRRLKRTAEKQPVEDTQASATVAPATTVTGTPAPRVHKSAGAKAVAVPGADIPPAKSPARPNDAFRPPAQGDIASPMAPTKAPAKPE